MVTRNKLGIFKSKVYTIVKHPLLIEASTVEPITVKQALEDQDWKKTMDNEFFVLLKNNAWELVSFNS